MLKIIVTIIVLAGPNMASDQSNAWWRNSFKPLGYNMVVEKVIHRPDFAAKLNVIEDDGWYKKHARARAWVRRQKTKGIVLIKNPPIFDGHQLYSGGIGDVCKPHDGVAIAYIDDKNSSGEDRRYNAQIIIAHEVGHSMGAFHDNTIYEDGASIMHWQSAGPTFIHPNEVFSDLSKQQMATCIGYRW